MFNVLTADLIIPGAHPLSPNISLDQSQFCVFLSVAESQNHPINPLGRQKASPGEE